MKALSIAYYSGTVTGMLTDGLGFARSTIIFIIYGKAAPDALLGFGLAARWWRCSCVSAAVFIPRQPM